MSKSIYGVSGIANNAAANDCNSTGVGIANEKTIGAGSGDMKLRPGLMIALA